MDCSLSGSSVHGILWARILEWVAISFSRESSQPSDRIQVSCIAGRFFTVWATKKGPEHTILDYLILWHLKLSLSLSYFTILWVTFLNDSNVNNYYLWTCKLILSGGGTIDPFLFSIMEKVSFAFICKVILWPTYVSALWILLWTNYNILLTSSLINKLNEILNLYSLCILIWQSFYLSKITL